MPFVDTLRSENADGSVLMVDRFHRPGGHLGDTARAARYRFGGEVVTVLAVWHRKEAGHCCREVDKPTAKPSAKPM
jgi:hypothetical protein